MVLTVKLFEVASHNDVEMTAEHIVKEVLVLTGDCAIFLSEWFYGKYGSGLIGDYRESNHYVTVTGDGLLELLKVLEYVLLDNDANKLNQYVKAVYYFPIHYTGLNLDLSYTLKPFTDEYITALKELYTSLKTVIKDDDILNRERLFLYNISW